MPSETYDRPWPGYRSAEDRVIMFGMFSPRKRVALLAVLVVLAVLILAFFHQHLRMTYFRFFVQPEDTTTNSTTSRFLHNLSPLHHDDHYHHHHDHDDPHNHNDRHHLQHQEAPSVSTNLITGRSEATSQVDPDVAIGGKEGPPPSVSEKEKKEGEEKKKEEEEKKKEKEEEKRKDKEEEEKKKKEEEKKQEEKEKQEKKKRKRIVYACSGGCGGWADRQKGIVGAYVLASMLDRDFGVYMTFPCELGRLLDEGSVPWKVTGAPVAVASSEMYTELDHQAVTFTQTFLKEKDLDRRFPKDVTVLTWNMEVVQYLQKHQMASRLDWLWERPVPDVYQRVLRDLFVLKPPLQNDLDILNKARPPGTQLVCAQVRLGKHNGSFPDVESWHTFEQLPILLDFMARYNDSRRYRIFFSSDSVEIIQRAKTHFPGVSLDPIPGPITHTDKSQGPEACQGFQKALTDQYALSLCDVLVISESGIGKIAAFLRGTDQGLYLFHDVKIEPFARGGTFPNKGGW